MGEKNRNDFEEMSMGTLYTYIIYTSKGREKYMSKPVIYDNKENLYAKKHFTRFFAKNMEGNMMYFKEPKDSIVYFTDVQTKRVIYDV